MIIAPLLPFLISMLCIASCAAAQLEKFYTDGNKPKLIVVFVIDQFAADYLDRLAGHLKGGLKQFMQNGTIYSNAFHKHAIPETAPGHSTISTGLAPCDHGIPLNSWFDLAMDPIQFSEDLATRSKLLPTGSSGIGRSAHQLKADTTSDQLALHQVSTQWYKSFSVSGKARSAIATAGRLGTAFWFDEQQGIITSSKAYMQQLPVWARTFNEMHAPHNFASVAWQSRYKRESAAYDFPFVDDDCAFELPFRLVDNLNIPTRIDPSLLGQYNLKKPYDLYRKTPAANKLLLDFALECLKNNLPSSQQGATLLWVCLSPLDLLGHFYGPDSREVIDFIYHLDQQLATFMKSVCTLVDQKKVLFVCTADHGIAPMPEIAKKKGIANAHRIYTPHLIQEINDRVSKEFDIKDFIACCEPTSFFINPVSRQDALAAGTYDDAVELSKKIIQASPGIKRVWTQQELVALECLPDSYEQFYKNQLFSDRIGDIICQPNPYCLLSKYRKGTSHQTPYNYDTRVPLILMQHGATAPKTVQDDVDMKQLAPTLADILGVERPSAAVAQPLPRFFPPSTPEHGHTTTPRITIVVVIDQFGFHYLNQLQPYFKYGFKKLLDHGVVFEQAHHPQAAPVTATGHAALSTGAYAAQHGIIMNNWYDNNGQFVSSVDDDPEKAAVLSSNDDNPCSYGASGNTIMCPGISDILVENSTPDQPFHVWALSYKNRAAIGMAGKQGNAIWFDPLQEIFTSSKAYFDTIPAWVKKFNKQSVTPAMHQPLHWELMLPRQHDAYKKYVSPSFRYNELPTPLAGNAQAITPTTGCPTASLEGPDGKQDKGITMFMLHPQANSVLFDLGLACLHQHLTSPRDRMLLWLSLSSFDKCGHFFGPTSLENVDMTLQIDKQLGDFMDRVEQEFGIGNVQFILTADHGASPIPEYVHDRGYEASARILIKPEIEKMNAEINDQFDVENAVLAFRTNQFYMNPASFNNLDGDLQKKIIRYVKQYVRKIAGVHRVWTADELNMSQTRIGSFKHNFKYQLFPGRSGQIIMMSAPYAMHTNYLKGTCHRTPYAYDTHVPIIFYQPGRLRSKRIKQKVWVTQIAPSLAKIYKIKLPQTSQQQTLPRVTNTP